MEVDSFKIDIENRNCITTVNAYEKVKKGDLRSYEAFKYSARTDADSALLIARHAPAVITTLEYTMRK